MAKNYHSRKLGRRGRWELIAASIPEFFKIDKFPIQHSGVFQKNSTMLRTMRTGSTINPEKWTSRKWQQTFHSMLVNNSNEESRNNFLFHPSIVSVTCEKKIIIINLTFYIKIFNKRKRTYSDYYKLHESTTKWKTK